MARSRRVREGDRAPHFELPDQRGDPVRLADLLARGAVVLYFYPRDDTQGCTAEACAFRDSYEDFQDAGAEVVGVSSDSVDSHRSFAAGHQLPFVLLSDAGGKLRQRYGVPSTLGLLDGRVTYVIGQDGVVRHVFSSQIRARRHHQEALATIRSMASVERSEVGHFPP
jgi:thioredoxin-dependent peroxiredoxin